MKLRHIKADGTAVVPFILPHMIPDRDIPIEAYVEQLKTALVYTPQLVRILVTIGPCLECDGLGYKEEIKIESKDGRDVERILQRICQHCRGVEPEEKVHGFIIAYAPEGMSYVFVNQC